MKTTPALLALLALTTGAFAQDDAKAAKLQLARDVMAVMKVDKMFDGMAAQMKQMAVQMASPAGVTPEDLAKVEALQGKIADLTMGYCKGIVAKMDAIYADVYTEGELKAMKTFYSSPEGQSMLEKQPKVMEAIMPFMQNMQRDLAPKIQELVNQVRAVD